MIRALQISSWTSVVLVLLAGLMACPIPKPPPKKPVADFTAAPRTGEAPLAVQFTDTSVPGDTPITGYLWEFGDGATSSARHPAHTYMDPGSYTVTLQVQSSWGNDTFQRTNYISVLPPELPFEVLFDTTNSQAVQNGPDAPVRIEVNLPVYIGRLTHYHWNLGRGQTPGLIWLEDGAGTVFGPWQAWGLPGQGGIENVFWRVYPDLLLPPRAYTIHDSDPDTWSHNAASGGSGFVVLEGAAAETLSSVEIGAGGGVIEAGGIRVEVPAGAFEGNQQLALGGLGVVHGAETPAYSLAGLPRVLLAPIQITLIPDEDPGEDEAHVELLEKVLLDGDQQVLDRWAILPTTVSDGVLHATLPPYAYRTEKDGVTPEMVAGLRGRLKQVRVRSANLNFLFNCPIAIISTDYASGAALGKMRELGAVLEECLTLLKDRIGLSFDQRPAARWPVDVQFGEFPGEEADTVWGRCCYSPRGREFDWLEINSKMLKRPASDSGFRVTVAHELFHLGQALAVNPEEHAFKGLREMFSVWLEWRLAGAEYVPFSFGPTSAALFPYNGLLRDTESAVLGKDKKPSPARHGYASSLFLRRLYPPDGSTDASIGLFWNLLSAAPDPVVVFDLVSGETWPAIWRDFARELYTGQVPGTATMATLITEATMGDLWVVTPTEDTVSHTFTGKFPALSAQPFAIAIMPAPAKAETRGVDLVITPTGFTPSMDLTVYSMQFGEEGGGTPLGTVRPGGSFTVENAERQEGVALVVTQTATNTPTQVNAQVTCTLKPRPSGVWRLQQVTTHPNPAENNATYTFEATAADTDSSTGARWMGRDYPEEGGSIPVEVFIRSRRTWSALPAVLTPGDTVMVTLNLEMTCTPNIYRYLDYDGMPDLTSLIYMRDGRGQDINGDRTRYINAQSRNLTGANALTDSDTIPWTIPPGNYDGQEYELNVVARDAGTQGLARYGAYNDYLQTATVTYHYVYGAY